MHLEKNIILNIEYQILFQKFDNWDIKIEHCIIK